MAEDLKGIRVATLAADGVERAELEQPRGALYGAGADTDLLSTHSGEIHARQQFDPIPAGTLPVDRQVSDASAREYDALLLPGGTVNSDILRLNSDPVGFVGDFAFRAAIIAHFAGARVGACPRRAEGRRCVD
jgi:protease I